MGLQYYILRVSWVNCQSTASVGNMVSNVFPEVMDSQALQGIYYDDSDNFCVRQISDGG